MSDMYYIYFEVLAFLSSFTVLFSKKVQPFKYLWPFPLFLLTTVCVEIYTVWLLRQGFHTNHVINVFTAIEFVFYLWFFFSITTSKRGKKIIIGLMISFAIFITWYFTFIQDMGYFHSRSYAVGCLLIIGCSIAYIFQLFRSPRSSQTITNPAFWIVCGILFFYTIAFPLHGLMISLKLNMKSNLLIYFMHLLWIINVCLYSLFAVGFWCRIIFREP